MDIEIDKIDIAMRVYAIPGIEMIDEAIDKLVTNRLKKSRWALPHYHKDSSFPKQLWQV